MKVKMIIVLLISIIILMLLIILNLTIGLMKHPPKVKVFDETNKENYVYAIQSSYTWRFLNSAIASDSIHPYEMFTTYEKDFQSGILKINPNSKLNITFPKAWVVNLSKIIIDENGNISEEQIQQQYGWNSINLITPENTGKYVYIINLVYPQGSSSYSFMLDVK